MALVWPLVLAQFIASFAATNMNVAISNIAVDLKTTVIGVQTAITLFTLVMAALMIPGSKLTDIWGRKVCLVLGLVIYGIGALLAALAPRLGLLVIGYSGLEGIGSALLIPPVYILITVLFSSLTERAKYFGMISAAGGVGAAAGPLIGGLITSTVSWRASFLLQVVVVAGIIYMCRRIPTDEVAEPRPAFDVLGAVLSAGGLVLVVLGILQTRTAGWLAPSVWLLIGLGAAVLAGFYWHMRSWERRGREALLSTRLFAKRTANAGLATQLLQWLTVQGSFFVVSVFLQTVRGLSAIATGLMLTPATLGILVASALAERMASRRSQAMLIRGGFVAAMIGTGLLLWLARGQASYWTFVPGLLVIGLGIGVMLTASVNVVQSSFGEQDQGEISGLSRSVSNLGSSLGTAIAGSVLVMPLVTGNRHFGLALMVILVADALGLVAALAIPSHPPAKPAGQPTEQPSANSTSEQPAT